VLLVDVSTQVPPHFVSASGQPITHIPATHTRPAPHGLPHPPQLLGSENVLTHIVEPASPHAVVCGGQTQLPPVHCVPLVHALPHLPQSSEVCCKLTQAPLHSASPAGHEHIPAVQFVFPVQTAPHAPQF
jgi:hypothetical protein